MHQNKEFIFVLLTFLCHGVQPNVFAVYPFKVEAIKNDDNVYLVYPENEDLMIMTPTPVEEYNQMVLESQSNEISLDVSNDPELRTTTLESTTDTTEDTTKADVLDTTFPVDSKTIEKEEGYSTTRTLQTRTTQQQLWTTTLESTTDTTEDTTIADVLDTTFPVDSKTSTTETCCDSVTPEKKERHSTTRKPQTQMIILRKKFFELDKSLRKYPQGLKMKTKNSKNGIQ